MNKRVFVVSPDYIPKQFLEWYRLKMAIQKDLAQPIELLMPAGQRDYHHIITQQHPDIVFANPFDASRLIKENHYLPLAKPAKHADEVTIFSLKKRMKSITDIQKDMVFAAMANRGIEMIGVRLLEAANLTKDALQWHELDYFQAVVRMVYTGEADAGLILTAVFNDLHPTMQAHFQVLAQSELEAITHIFLVRDDDPELREQLIDILQQSKRKTRYYAILREINCRHGFDMMNSEDGTSLADILETLQD